jgi:predicted type IV restriction endonuclease
MDFTQALTQAAREMVKRADRCRNEESTKQFLVLPFIRFLGYDILDPEEVVPEHSADFSDKYKNRVDYAICRDGIPVIAIEVKTCGEDMTKDHGQLKSYFNAVPTIKMAVLTNGLDYQCYSDTIEQNIMDERAFLIFSMKQLSTGQIDETTLNGVANLKKDTFDPSAIGSKARENLMLNRFEKAIEAWTSNPSDDVIRLLLREASYEGRIGQRLVDEHRGLAVQAFGSFIDKKILERVGFADRPVVKIDASATRADGSEVKGNADASNEEDEQTWAVATELESSVFDYCCRRWLFLPKKRGIFKSYTTLNIRH